MRECGSGFRRRSGSLLLGGFCALLLGGCGSVGCDDHVIQREPRTNARGAGVVFIRDCGALRGERTGVAVVRTPDAPPRAGQVLFVADGGDRRAAVRIRWIDVNHLQIAHDPRARTVHRAPVERDLRITHVPLSGPAD